MTKDYMKSEVGARAHRRREARRALGGDVRVEAPGERAAEVQGREARRPRRRREQAL